MCAVRRRPVRMPRAEHLETRALLNSDMGMWPLANPTPDNTVLVRFVDNAPAASVQAVLTKFHATVMQTFPDATQEIMLGQGFSATASIAALYGSPLVARAEPNSAIQATGTPNDTYYASEWGLNQSNDVDIDAPEAWSITTGTSATTVAVTDTGIDYRHPDLYLNVALNQGEIPSTIKSALIDTNADGRLDFYDLNSLDAARTPFLNSSAARVNAWATRDLNANGYIDASDLFADTTWMNASDNDGNGYKDDIIGWNFVANTNNPLDDNNHGTHVSGTIAAVSNNGVGVTGIAWNARILALKILDSSGNGVTSAAVSSINYAAKQGARVINASWGGAPYSSSLATAISSAGNLGSVFVAAAGNTTSNNDTTPYYPASYRTSNEITVAAIASSGYLATFSSYGASTVDIGAPGQSIISTVIGGGYASKSGTSMAAPHVAGVVALLAGQNPQFSASQLVQRVLANAKPLASLAGKTITGGVVDAMKALGGTSATVPTAPTNLAASATSSTSVQLTWAGASTAASYKLERSPDGTNGWTQIAVIVAPTTSYADSNLSSATTYYYRVRATNTAGDSAYSSTASGTTSAATQTAPTPPTNLTVVTVSSSSIQLSWTGVSGASSYKVLRSPNGTSNWTQVGTTSSTTTVFNDPGLASGATYFYEVVASNTAGDSAPSGIVSAATTLAVPSSPTSLIAKPASSSSTQLSWNGVAGAATYKILRSLDGSTNWIQVGANTSASTTYSDSGLAAGTSYYYEVVASNSAGNSAPSNVAFATTPAPVAAPSAPASLTATATAFNKVALSWTSVSNATSYTIQRSLDGINWTLLATTASGTTSYSDGGVSPSTKYYYRISASNSGGVSPYSNIASVTTPKKGK